MTMNVTRRAVLGFGGGAAVGIMLSPAPWKLVDDLGIWTQNWKWIPRPPHGPVSIRTTACSLCPAGCGIEARCIGGSPVSLRAVANDPTGAGALCPLGQAGHHLPYHPSRLTSPARVVRRNGVGTDPMTLGEVVAETSRSFTAGGTVALLDMRPGRSVSWGWRRLMSEVPGGVVIAAPGREGSSLTTLRGMLHSDAPEVGLDLEHARGILSFGAPLAEGWGSPGLTAKLLRRGKGEVQLIQVDPTRTRSAAIADRWLPARPGTEAVLALGIGHVLLAEGLAIADAMKSTTDVAGYATLVAQFTPATVETITGVPAGSIVAAARELAVNLPAVVIAGEDGGGGRLGALAETAILGLNGLLGVPNAEGGVIARSGLPAPFGDEKLAAVTELHDVADASISLLIVDSSAGESLVPWPAIARKLTGRDARVVVMTPFLAGLALHANLVIPTAPFLEGTQEIPSPFDATRPTLGLAAPLVSARDGAIDPVEFVRTTLTAASIAAPEGWSTSADLLRARVAAVHTRQKGEVVKLADGSRTALSDLGSPDDLWTALAQGGRWQETPALPAPFKWNLLGGREAELTRLAAQQKSKGLTLVLRAPRDAAASAAVSPVFAKIYQESALRRSAGTAALNPQTARQLQLRKGRLARLETSAGSIEVTVATDAAVMPGVIELTVGPSAVSLGDGKRGRTGNALDICTADANGVWRSAPAKLVEA